MAYAGRSRTLCKGARTLNIYSPELFGSGFARLPDAHRAEEGYVTASRACRRVALSMSSSSTTGSLSFSCPVAVAKMSTGRRTSATTREQVGDASNSTTRAPPTAPVAPRTIALYDTVVLRASGKGRPERRQPSAHLTHAALIENGRHVVVPESVLAIAAEQPRCWWAVATTRGWRLSVFRPRGGVATRIRTGRMPPNATGQDEPNLTLKLAT